MLRVGSTYVAHEIIGRGTTGTVWRGDGPDGPVAIKVLRPELAGDEELVARFLRERSLLTRVRHPNVVAVRDLVAEGETLALVMDLVPGPSLRDRLHQIGVLPPAEAANVVAAVAAGMSAIHAAGAVHRDVKPENVLLRDAAAGAALGAAFGDALGPVLTDLGVASLLHGGRLTRGAALVGTPEYLAPELAAGLPPSPSADVYAAGVVLYELLCGGTPFRAAHPAAIMHRHLHDRPEPIPGAPPELWELVCRCLAKEPAHRPGAAELAAALRAAERRLGGYPAEEPPISAAPGHPTHVSGDPGVNRSAAFTGQMSAPALVASYPSRTVSTTQAGFPAWSVPNAGPAMRESVLGSRDTAGGVPAAAAPVACHAGFPFRRAWRRWYAAIGALALTGAVLLVSPGIRHDDGLVYRADSGSVCGSWRGDGSLAEQVRLRSCIRAGNGSVVAYAHVHAARPTNVTVEMHLVQAGESEWIVASGRCDIPALAHAAVNCGPLRHPMNKGRYYAFATDASGTLAATPLVSQ